MFDLPDDVVAFFVEKGRDIGWYPLRRADVSRLRAVFVEQGALWDSNVEAFLSLFKDMLFSTDDLIELSFAEDELIYASRTTKFYHKIFKEKVARVGSADHFQERVFLGESGVVILHNDSGGRVAPSLTDFLTSVARGTVYDLPYLPEDEYF